MICHWRRFSVLLIFAAVILSAGRLAGAASAKSHSSKAATFRLLQSANYDLYTNASGRGALNRILKKLENAREHFGRYLPVPAGRTASRGIIRLFRTREQYLSAVGADFKWSGGLWNGKELLISPLPGEHSANDNRKFIREVIFHEGFHQYLSGITDNIPTGMWFNEGCAQLFVDLNSSGSVILSREKEKTLGSVAVKHPVPVKTLMALNNKNFYAPDMRNSNYQTSHALMYYLYFGAPAENSPCAAIPDRYIDLLYRYRDPDQAMAGLAAEFNLDKLDTDFRSFWGSPSRLSAARTYSRNRSR